MDSKPILNRIGERELSYVKQVLDSGFRSSQGATFMKRLESAACEVFGSSYAISMINGTATLHASLEAAGIGPGDEVIVPPLTMSATTFAVLQAGGTPVFADVDADTFQISSTAVERCLTPSTRAIITVALYGLSPDMNPIMSIANRNSLFLLEDNAECFLGSYEGRLVGRFGTASSFSFQSSKHLTSGEGGLVLTDDEEIATKVRRISSLGYAGVNSRQARITKSDIQNPNYSRHLSLGWNYRMPELCCAVALAQMERIEELVSRRQEVAKLFLNVVSSSSVIKPQVTPSNCVNSYWTFVCKIEDPAIDFISFRNEFVGRGGDGIYAAWKLSYLEPMFVNRSLLGRDRSISENRLSQYRRGLCPNAEDLQPRLLQFKTNYWNWADAERQAEILDETLSHFE